MYENPGGAVAKS